MNTDTAGYCEGLCGGLNDLHLVDGLCPVCRKDQRIRMLGDRQPEPVTFDDDEEVIGIDATLLSPEMKRHVSA